MAEPSSPTGSRVYSVESRFASRSRPPLARQPSHGRPTRCTPAFIAWFCAGVEKQRSEAGLLRDKDKGIPVSRFYAWLAAGREGVEPYATFYRRLVRARERARKARILRRFEIRDAGLLLIVERTRPRERDATRRQPKPRQDADAVLPAVGPAVPVVVES
jgi:hypothetical protein